MKVLTKDDILNSKDLKSEKVEIPEWGGAIYIRTITGLERDQFEASMTETEGIKNLRAKLVVLTAVDSEGKRLFSEKDAAELGRKNAAALDRCFKVAQKLNGWGVEVEKITKNFLADLSEGPTSD